MSDIRSIEYFYQNMGIPDACMLGKRIFKKQFYEHGQLGVADKKEFVEDIEGIDWRYTLKPSTVNIPKLEDDTHEYLEIAILQVVLTAIERHARIAAVIQKAIPYPLLIVFISGGRLAISATDKRINRADANKIVIEAAYDTGWIDTVAPSPEQSAFLSDFRVTNFSFRNLYDFYQDAVGRIIALNCATHSGSYTPPGVDGRSKADRLAALREIEKLHQERVETRNKLKKERNLGSQVSLNTRIKQLNDRIEAIRNELWGRAMDALTKEEGESLNIVEENIEALRAIFPDAFTEDGIDFATLRQLLGDDVADGDEKYGLTWHGKKKARQIALTPSTGTLRPCPEEGVDWDTTQNLFIEGDNLEVLKLLQKSYANRVKMIYIDPPYNTGKEFIYPDSFQDNLDTYLKYTAQKDEEGLKVSSNTESSGRFHTNWLNLMYPRVKLAKNLLHPDGVMFISIDDGEQSNLRKLCDEIFGEENCIANAIWRSKDNSNNDAKRFSTDHNHILVYSKSSDWLPERIFDEAKQSHFKNPDNDPRGPYFDGNPLNSPNYRENLIYDLISPSGNVIKPPKNGWRWSKKVIHEKIASGEIRFNDDETGIRRRTYLEDMKGLPPSSLWMALLHNVGMP